MQGLTIGQFAAAAGVHVETVRYYQRRGLLERPPKPATGFRRYDPGALTTLRFIHAAKGLGFTLAEITGLLALLKDSEMSCGRMVEEARGKREQIRAKIAELEAMLKTLDEVVECCGAEPPGAPCPVNDFLPGFDSGCACGGDCPCPRCRSGKEETA